MAAQEKGRKLFERIHNIFNQLFCSRGSSEMNSSKMVLKTRKEIVFFFFCQRYNLQVFFNCRVSGAAL